MLAQNLIDNAWRAYPHTFAERMSGHDWSPYPYLVKTSEAIADAVYDGNEDIILVNMPPQHGKSELISKYTPAWFLDRFPKENCAVTSYEAEYAAEWGSKTRDLIINSKLSHIELRKDSKAKNKWNTTAGGGMITAGAGGAITGRGFKLFLIDDPYKNWVEASSPVTRKKVIDWFKSVAITRRRRGCVFVILMTRWHEDDLCGWLLREYPHRVKHIVFPAIAEENDCLGRKPGEALCPELHTVKELAGVKELSGSFFWNAMYQQRPSPPEGGLIKRVNIQYYKELPSRFNEMIQSWDFTFKETQKGSYVCGQAWRRLTTECYLIDQVRDRMDFVATLKAFKAFTAKHKQTRKKLVEEKANGSAIMSMLKSEISGIVGINPRGSKEARMAAVSPMFESGNVWLPDPTIAPWIHDYVEEMVSFPNAKNDDQGDTTSQALDYFHEKTVRDLRHLLRW